MRAPGASTAISWTSRRPLLLVALVGLLLVVTLASQADAGVTQAGAADPPPYLADASHPAVTTLASDRGISIEEAQRRIGWQEPAMELARELERALGDRYGDLWFDVAHGGRVKVGIVGGDTTTAARLIARRKLTAATDLVPVRHSYPELVRAATWLTAEIARANPPAGKGTVKGLTVWRLPDRNLVELSLPQGQRLTAAQQATVAEARRRLGDMLTLGSWSGQIRDLNCAWRTSPSRFDCDPPLRGGVMLYVRSGAYYVPECTVGFNARSTIDGKWYVMTAGHCGEKGRNFYVRQPRTGQYHVLGHMHNRRLAGDDDFGIITIDNVAGWDPQPWVYRHPSADTDYDPRYPITGTAGSTYGLEVCVSGAVSGSDCGYVERVGDPVGGLAQVDLCATNGDSGAPIYSYNRARGLLKGANPTETGQSPPACQDRLYQGLTEAEQWLHVAAVHI
jgi:streptogrisin C